MSTNTWGDLIARASSGFDLLPDGRQVLLVKKAVADVTNNGKPCINVNFVVADGPLAGKTLFNKFTLTEDNPVALGIFFSDLAAFGITGEVLAQAPPLEQGGLAYIAQLMVGKTVSATISKREFPQGSGTMRNQLNNFQAQTSSPTPVTPSIPSSPAPSVPGSAPSVPGPAPAPAPANPIIPF